MNSERSSILQQVEAAGRRRQQLPVRWSFRGQRSKADVSAPLSLWSSCRSWSTASRGATTCRCWSGTPSPRPSASPRLRSRSGFRTDAPSGRRSVCWGGKPRSSSSTASHHFLPSARLWHTVLFTASSARPSRCLHLCSWCLIIIITHDARRKHYGPTCTEANQHLQRKFLQIMALTIVKHLQESC